MGGGGAMFVIEQELLAIEDLILSRMAFVLGGVVGHE